MRYIRSLTLGMSLLSLCGNTQAETISPEGAALRAGEKIVINTTVCDTQKQAEMILEATRDMGFPAGAAVFRWMNSNKNRFDDPLCVVGLFEIIPIQQVSKIDHLDIGEGVKQTIYVIEVRLPNGYVCYAFTRNPVVKGTDA